MKECNDWMKWKFYPRWDVLWNELTWMSKNVMEWWMELFFTNESANGREQENLKFHS